MYFDKTFTTDSIIFEITLNNNNIYNFVFNKNSNINKCTLFSEFKFENNNKIMLETINNIKIVNSEENIDKFIDTKQKTTYKNTNIMFSNDKTLLFLIKSYNNLSKYIYFTFL